jgi:hypothetical protein
LKRLWLLKCHKVRSDLSRWGQSFDGDADVDVGDAVVDIVVDVGVDIVVDGTGSDPALEKRLGLPMALVYQESPSENDPYWIHQNSLFQF